MKKITIILLSLLSMAVSCEEQGELQLDPTQNLLDKAPLWESGRLSETEEQDNYSSFFRHHTHL